MLENTPENRKQARALHSAGRLDAARVAYEAMLAGTPGDADLLGLLGAVALQQGQMQKAEALFERSLAAPAEPRIQVRNLYYFGLLLRATGRDTEARDLAVAEAPEWPEDEPADTDERDAVIWLAETLVDADDALKARRFLDRAMPDRSGDAAALMLNGRLALKEDDAARAAEVLMGAAKLAPTDPQPLITLSFALKKAGEGIAARATAQRIALTWPAYADPPHPSHRATLLVFNQAPKTVHSPNVGLRGVHFLMNFAGQIAKSMQSEYRFLSLFADLPEDALPVDGSRGQLPAADVLLNNLVNSEHMNVPGRLSTVRARLDRFNLPVINHPDQVFQTTRLKNAALLAGIPNLKVPRIEHYRSDQASHEAIVADIGQRFDYPVIVRKTAAHQSSGSLLTEDGKVAVLVADPAALRDHLKRYDWDEFYAVEFVDLKRRDGLYRQQRAVVMDNEIIVNKSSIFREWMVSGWRHKPAGIEFYRANPQTIEECNRVVGDPEAYLGAAAMRTIGAIRDRMPLDMFGIDFDVDRDGQVVFFEAGAAMIFQQDISREPPEVRLPREPSIRIDDAFHELVARRIAEGPRQPT